MNICIPLKTNDGLTSEISQHFGSSPYFMIHNTDQGESEILENANAHHSHGMCQPLKTLEKKNIEAVVCCGMGRKAVQKLNAGGIKAFRASAQTVGETLKKYKENELREITAKNACNHHNCH